MPALVSSNGKLVKDEHPFQASIKFVHTGKSIAGKLVRLEQPAHEPAILPTTLDKLRAGKLVRLEQLRHAPSPPVGPPSE